MKSIIMIITMYLTFFIIITNLLDFSKHIHTTLLRESQFANVYSNKRNRAQVPYFCLNPNGLHVDLVVKKNAISCQHMLNLLLLLAALVVRCVRWSSLAPCPCHCLNNKAVTMIQRTKNATAVINCARAAYSWSGN